MSKSRRKRNRNKKKLQHPLQQTQLPIIAIIGTRNGQETLVEKLCDGVAKLKFVDADLSQPQIPSADAVFLLTRFISHRWTDAAQKQFASNRIYFISGGISGLAHRIRLKAAKILLLSSRATMVNVRK